MAELTIGEKRVGVDFNVTNDKKVDSIKTKAAELINEIYSLVEPGERSEKARCVAEAMTAIEDGAMWAVKANFR